MATIPDDAMKGIATSIIELLGDEMTFERRQDDGSWATSASNATVHIQSRNPFLHRGIGGIGDVFDYTCFSPFETDIQMGDRTPINGVYYLVEGLRDMGTHLEFGLKETDEAP